MKKMLQRTGLALAGLLASLALGELGIRLSGRAPEMSLISVGRFQLSSNPRLGYEPVPGFEYHGQQLDHFEFRGRSNRLGFRDRDHEIKKPAGTYRILVLGDSITMGLSVERTEDVFTAVLERELRGKGHAADVLNFGVSGYNTQQEVEILADKGLTFKPDLVILAYCLNDTLQMNGGIIHHLRKREKQAQGIAHYQLTPRLARSALYRLIRSRFYSDRIVEERVQHYRDLKADTVEPSLKKLRRLADAHGFDVLVAVMPADKDRGRPEQYAQIAQRAAAQGLPHLDLRAAFEHCAAAGENLYNDSWHPSAAGHDCLGRALAEHLAANGWLSENQETTGGGLRR